MEGWGAVTAVPVEATGPGAFPKGCRSAPGGTQENDSFLRCLQFKIR